MLGKDIFFFFFAESRSGLHIWDVSLTSSNCRIRPLYPSFFPGKSSIFQTSAFAFSSQAVALRKCYLVCKAMFVAVLLVSSSAAPLAEVPSSITAVCPGRCTGSPSQAWGFPLGLAFLPPDTGPGFLGEGGWSWLSPAGLTWPQQLRPNTCAQDAPGFQAVALLQHDLGQAAQKSGQLGDFPAGVGGEDQIRGRED